LKFAVVDLETTGGLAKRERITEVGIVIIEDGQIVQQYQSLVNPERSIPKQITRITGIDNEMVADAPKFYEIAKEIVLLTEACVFVAHNVNFDYSFLQEEFRRLGFTYSRRKLCTVKLSKRLFPHLKSHGLSNLIKVFNLPMANRHRALDDANATACFLMKVLKDHGPDNIKHIVNYGLKATQLPDNISLDRLHQLPETFGVYFFEDTEGRYLYIGKSNNIRKRVIQHFRKTTAKSQKILQSVHKISFETTAGELIALLKEDEYIKRYQPPINKAQRKVSFPYSLIKTLKDNGQAQFTVQKLTQKEKERHHIIADFHSMQSAMGRVVSICEDLQICKCNLLGEKSSSCWKKQIQLCRNNSINDDQLSLFEERVSQYFDKDMYILEPVNQLDEVGFIKIENGLCTGYGWINREEPIEHVEVLDQHLQSFNGSSYSNKIIFNMLSKSKAWKIIEL